jgi:hypothetical protein
MERENYINRRFSYLYIGPLLVDYIRRIVICGEEESHKNCT